MSIPTVAQVIIKLQTMPQELPCYFRPKYHGTVKGWEDVPVNLNGISDMEEYTINSEHQPRRVTFLC